MRILAAVTGLVTAGMGAIVALSPIWSVWRASGQGLELLPALAAETHDDHHGLTAIWDPEFIVATRTYRDTTPEQVEAALGEAGFEPATIAGTAYLVKECCGEYDAAWVEVGAGGEGQTVARITMADGDVQLTWVIFVVLGSSFLLGGLAIVLLAARSMALARRAVPVG